MIIGTNQFINIERANRYYSEYGYTPKDVQEKIRAGEIHIGRPSGVRETKVNNEGRYLVMVP